MGESENDSVRRIQVVLAEGDRPVRILLQREIPETGRLLVAVKSGVEAHELPRQSNYDQTVLDLEIPELGRVELFRRHSEEDEGDSEVLVVSAGSQYQGIAEALEPEAYDFLTKPLSSKELAALVKEVDSLPPSGSTTSRIRAQLSKNHPGAPLVGESPAMERLLQLVERVATSSATVLIQGETGSGKGMISRLIHELSLRSSERFVAINCSAFQDHLLESELFGHEKGAFTGASVAKQGLFEVADKGTLFLDEVAEMTPAMQAKLLHALDTGELRRVGGTKLRQVDTRILAASNKNLQEEVKEGRFREDLLFRLNVITLTVPPLRDRREEIPELIDAFLGRFSAQGLPAKTLSPSALALLQSYGWPGNVRELANTLEGLLLLTPGEVIRPDDLPQNIRPSLLQVPAASEDEASEALPPVPLTEVERVHVARVLRYTEGKKAPAARLLGIDVKTLNKKIHAYEIEL